MYFKMTYENILIWSKGDQPYHTINVLKEGGMNLQGICILLEQYWYMHTYVVLLSTRRLCIVDLSLVLQLYFRRQDKDNKSKTTVRKDAAYMGRQ